MPFSMLNHMSLNLGTTRGLALPATLCTHCPIPCTIVHDIDRVFPEIHQGWYPGDGTFAAPCHWCSMQTKWFTGAACKPSGKILTGLLRLD